MFRNTRMVHKWIGAIMSLILVMMAITGLLLAVKKRFDWLQPPTTKGTKIESPAEIMPMEVIANAVFAAGIPELKSMDDVDRFELHLSKGIFKVTSTKGYREVQVEAKTGKVLATGKRNDSFVEHIHDMSFFGPTFHDWLLPLAALCLFTLGVTGLFMFFVPIYRRWQFKRGKAKPKASP